MRMGRGWMLRRLLFLCIWGGERKVVRGEFVRIKYHSNAELRPQVNERPAPA